MPFKGHGLCRLGLYLEQKIRLMWLGSRKIGQSLGVHGLDSDVLVGEAISCVQLDLGS